MTSRVWCDALIDSAFIYPDSASVPPAPSLSLVLEWLDSSYVPDPNGSSLKSCELRFDGMRTTGSGAMGQHLVETIGDLPTPGPLPSRLLRLLAVARPDLRSRLACLGNSHVTGDSFEVVTFGPIFLHGGAWEKTDSWIGSYGDLDTLLAWKFLDADLKPGHMFTHELLPGLDLNMTGWVVRKGPVTTSAGTFDQAIECIYFIDFGTFGGDSIFHPDPQGYYGFYSAGKVIYAPTVGPVYLYERILPAAGDSLGTGVGDLTVELKSIRAGSQAR